MVSTEQSHLNWSYENVLLTYWVSNSKANKAGLLTGLVCFGDCNKTAGRENWEHLLYSVQITNSYFEPIKNLYNS
jgi:hypothetical protein